MRYGQTALCQRQQEKAHFTMDFSNQPNPTRVIPDTSLSLLLFMH